VDGRIALEEHFVTQEPQRCIAAVDGPEAAWRKVIDRARHDTLRTLSRREVASA
jgi:hypothetical protein